MNPVSQFLQTEFQILDAMLEAALKTRNWRVYNCIEKMLFKEFGKERKLILQHYGALKALRSLDNVDVLLDKMVEDNLIDPEANKNKISVLLARGDLEEAIQSLNQYLKMAPLDREAWVQLADIYLLHQE